MSDYVVVEFDLWRLAAASSIDHKYLKLVST
jgi:hypothetical protein